MSPREKIRFALTERHIEDGVPGYSSRCPVALAVREATGAAAVGVTAEFVSIRMEADSLAARSYPTSRRLRSFVEAFDAGRPVRPGVFEVGA